MDKEIEVAMQKAISALREDDPRMAVIAEHMLDLLKLLGGIEGRSRLAIVAAVERKLAYLLLIYEIKVAEEELLMARANTTR